MKYIFPVIYIRFKSLMLTIRNTTNGKVVTFLTHIAQIKSSYKGKSRAVTKNLQQPVGN